MLDACEGWPNVGKWGSNFDHEIDTQVCELLEAAPEAACADYPGWDFHGQVWVRADGKWACQPWRFGTPQEIILADSPKELMEAVCAFWGNG